jgi:hypothetical protein
MDFLALAFESSGKMHEDVIDFVKAFVKPDAENRGFDPDRSTRFWISQISMAIQRLSSQMIITRSCQINGRFQNPVVTKEITAALENYDVVDGRAPRKNHSNKQNNRKKSLDDRLIPTKIFLPNDHSSRSLDKNHAKNNQSLQPVATYKSSHRTVSLLPRECGTTTPDEPLGMPDESPKSEAIKPAATYKSSHRTVSLLPRECRSIPVEPVEMRDKTPKSEAIKLTAITAMYRSNHRTVSLLPRDCTSTLVEPIGMSDEPPKSPAMYKSSHRTVSLSHGKTQIKETSNKPCVLDPGIRHIPVVKKEASAKTQQENRKRAGDPASIEIPTTTLSSNNHLSNNKKKKTKEMISPPPSLRIIGKALVAEPPQIGKQLRFPLVLNLQHPLFLLILTYPTMRRKRPRKRLQHHHLNYHLPFRTVGKAPTAEPPPN